MKNRTKYPYLTLITGGSRGIGYAIADAMAAKNSDLVLVAKEPKTLQAAQKKLKKCRSVNISTVAGDLSEMKGCEDVADYCIKHSLIPNLLVLDAGIFLEGSLVNSEPEDYQKTLSVNLHSVYYLVRRLVPLMKKAAAAARVVRTPAVAVAGTPVKAD